MDFNPTSRTAIPKNEKEQQQIYLPKTKFQGQLLPVEGCTLKFQVLFTFLLFYEKAIIDEPPSSQNSCE